MSTYMLKLSLLFFAVPPLLVLGIWNSFFSSRFVKHLEDSILNSKGSLLVFSIVMTAFHLPLLMPLVHHFHFLQEIILLILFFSAVGMWWPLISSHLIKEMCREERNMYVVMSKLLLLPSCVFMIISPYFSEGSLPILQHMSNVCLPPTMSIQSLLPFSIPYDHQVAGLIMLVCHKLSINMIAQKNRKSMYRPLVKSRVYPLLEWSKGYRH